MFFLRTLTAPGYQNDKSLVFQNRTCRILRMEPSYRRGFCIYIDTVCQGPVPIERKEDGFPVIHDTAEEAQRSIAEDAIERLEQFMKGEREFEDAITVEEYVVLVDVTPEGAVIDAAGNCFGRDF